MIFLDSNVPMYLVGGEHPNKDAAARRVALLVEAGEVLVTDVEVFQEILHRYVAIDRREFIRPAFDLLEALCDVVLPVEWRDVVRARDLVLSTPRVDARDALHVAVMEAHGVARILSFDRDFDRWPGITRIG